MRNLLSVVLAATMVAAGTAAVAAPAAAAAEPKAGDACTTADLGRRWPQVDTINVKPTITHFTGFYVTAGTTGQRQVTVQVQTQITVVVGRTAQITTGFSIKELFNVQSQLTFNVQKTTATTNNQQEVITWNFLQPGYYAVYKGTKAVTGTYSGLNCTRVGTALQWVKRESDSYTTYSSMEEGAVRCEDAVPPNSIMRKAQDALGCSGAPAKAPPKQQEPAGEPRAAEPVAAGVPPGFTCDGNLYRIGLGNGLYLYYPTKKTIDLKPYASKKRAGYAFQLCRGPGSGDLVEHVLLTSKGDCLTVQEQDLNTEGALIDDRDCNTVDDNQRWYVYRDAAAPNTVGIQVKRNGFMVGQERVTDGEAVRLYSTGVENGAGTYHVEPLV